LNDQSLNIIAAFMGKVSDAPGAIALIHEGHSVSYKDLLQDILCTVDYYRQKGIVAGTRVLVSIPMGIDCYRTLLALIYLGAVPVLLDDWLTGASLKHCLDLVPCDALIASPKLLFYTTFSGPLKNIPLKIKSGKMSSTAATFPPHHAAVSDTALITFTAGSTTYPNAADITHGLLNTQLSALAPLLPTTTTGQEKTLTTLPIIPLLQLAFGKTTVLPPDKFRIDKPDTVSAIVNTCREQKVTTLIISPSIMDALTAFSLPPIRHIITDGGPVFPASAGDITIRFPQATTTVIYGSAATAVISQITSLEIGNASLKTLKQWGLPVGVPNAATAVSIIPIRQSPIPPQSSFAWQQLQCPAGEAGEIVVTGEHVLKQYINNPEATARSLVRVDDLTWYRTGDAGRVSADGKLYFLGRIAEILEWNGKPLFPVIAANCFRMRSGVSEAAVLEHKGKLTLVIEAATPPAERVLAASLSDADLTGASIKYLKKIPKDPRYQTNIDYEKLANLL
jgi:acyl-CoA synthetase (AMP-forming)/AMP-acid ligase II